MGCAASTKAVHVEEDKEDAGAANKNNQTQQKNVASTNSPSTPAKDPQPAASPTAEDPQRGALKSEATNNSLDSSFKAETFRIDDKKKAAAGGQRNRFAFGGGRAGGAGAENTTEGKVVGISQAPKTAEQKTLLTKAILGNKFLSHCGESDIQVLVNSVVPLTVNAGQTVIQKGDDGNNFYVIDSGKYSVWVEDGLEKPNKHMGPGTAFGELALVYGSPRTATIKAETDGELWVLDRSTFVNILSNIAAENLKRLLIVLRKIPLLASLTEAQLETVAQLAVSVTVKNGDYIITQGEIGNEFFIIESGEVMATKKQDDGTMLELRKMGAGEYFGENALLWDEPRSANIVAMTDVECLSLGRETFNNVLGSIQDLLDRNAKMRIFDYIPTLKHLHHSDRNKCAEHVQLVEFNNGDVIAKKGQVLPGCYFVANGDVTADGPNGEAHLGTNDMIGIECLDGGACPVTATAQGKVKCLLLTAERYQPIVEEQRIRDVLSHIRLGKHVKIPAFQRQQVQEVMHIQRYQEGELVFKDGDTGFFIVIGGELEAIKDEKTIIALKRGNYFGEISLEKGGFKTFEVRAKQGAKCLKVNKSDFDAILGPLWYQLDHFESIATIGVGGHGRVKMVRHKTNKKVYAMKIYFKNEVTDPMEQHNIMNEKHLMSQLHSPFVVQMVRTFQDQDCLYLLMEIVYGGNLLNLMENLVTERFDEKSSQFFVGNTLLGLKYLHDKDILHRDIKPENLMLDVTGYVKITDFGCAKQTEKRTFTVLGTPDYVAPEVLLNKGHGPAVDYWAVGVLVYEFLAGRPPFESPDELERIYNIVGVTYEFPDFFTAPAKDLVSSLLQYNPEARLGAKNGVQDIMKHPWFKKIDWKALEAQQAKPPFKPPHKNDTDFLNFGLPNDDASIPKYNSPGGPEWFDGF
eukprot:GFYU01008183.1.p1 GENE.GFYU01008183.1~~GFYU01008183.1.p1  ORF type:complete len:915 (-),score=288.09 GFYU01008183.1:169-2913(-)